MKSSPGLFLCPKRMTGAPMQLRWYEAITMLLSNLRTKCAQLSRIVFSTDATMCAAPHLASETVPGMLVKPRVLKGEQI